MKSQSLKVIGLVKELATTINLRKAAEKKEKELKTQVHEVMGEELLLEAGDFAVCIRQKNKRFLDQKALQHDLGLELIQKYMKLTPYETMELTELARKAAQNE